MSYLDPEISSCFIQWMIHLFGAVVDRNVFTILPISAGYWFITACPAFLILNILSSQLVDNIMVAAVKEKP